MMHILKIRLSKKLLVCKCIIDRSLSSDLTGMMHQEIAQDRSLISLRHGVRGTQGDME